MNPRDSGYGCDIAVSIFVCQECLKPDPWQAGWLGASRILVSGWRFQGHALALRETDKASWGSKSRLHPRDTWSGYCAMEKLAGGSCCPPEQNAAHLDKEVLIVELSQAWEFPALATWLMLTRVRWSSVSECGIGGCVWEMNSFCLSLWATRRA